MSGFTGSTLRAHKEKGNAANVAFGNQIDHWSGLSLGRLFFRNSTSRFKAETTNCPVLSLGSFKSSISSAISCGTRAAIVCDFRLIALVAIIDSFLQKTSTVWQKKNSVQHLTCSTPANNMVLNTLIVSWCLNDNAPACGNTAEASNHNVKEAYIMACSHDTQTRPEFTYLFLGTPSDKPDVTPVVLRAEANTEQQARSHFLNWNLVFAAQIRTKTPCRLQLFDGGEHFSWLYEQRYDTCTSGVQEVAHG